MGMAKFDVRLRVAESDMVGVDIIGIDDLLRAVRRFGDKEIGKSLRVANRLAAQVVRDEARKRAPVGRTGLLRGTIRSVGTAKIARIRVGRSKATKTKGAVNYAWIIHGGREGGRGGPVPENPFLRDAISYKWEDMVDLYVEGIRDAARQVNLKYDTRFNA